MPKITLIGAGSFIFTRNLCSDLLLTPALEGCTIALMDIDAGRLEDSRAFVQSMIEARGARAHLEATTDLAEAVRGADYVITTFMVGGLDAYSRDIEIPRKYGVEQCVGDTLGPGGVMRALRTIPVLLNLCRVMDETAPNALLLNYVNPMAMNCWAVASTGRPHVGLCHSVQGTSEMIARWLELPYSELAYRCAGINHQAFFLELRRGQEDLYPRLREVTQDAAIYGQEPVRIDLFKAFGYFVTESSGHASEYVPYFRKNARMVDEELVPRFTNPRDDWLDWGRTGGCLRRTYERPAGLDAAAGFPDKRTHEYGSHIIEAIETARPLRINGNVPNHGLIDNLPDGCCVEVPCLVDENGIQPVGMGALPSQLAALNRTNINVQSLTVEAALTGRRDAIYQAVTLDPLTAAVCTLPQIHALVTEMLAAEEAATR